MVMDPDLRIVDVGPEFARLTKTRREEVIGKLFVNVVSDPNQKRHAHVTETVRQAAAIVIKTKQTHKMPVMRLDIVDPETHQAQERWWRPALAPMVRDEEIAYLVLRMEDVTNEERSFRLIRAQRRSNYILYVLALTAAALIGLGFSKAFHDTAKDTKRTCDVQKLTLKGYHLIGHIMFDINGILIHSPRHQPQPIPRKEKKYGLQLEQDLHKYLLVVHKLPTGRSCL